MHHLPPADELVDIRAQIARLRAREVELNALVLSAPAAPLRRARPGWPIRRQPAAEATPIRH